MKKIALAITAALLVSTSAQAQDFGGQITPEVGAGIAAGMIVLGAVVVNNGSSDSSTTTNN
ncbi:MULTISPECIES: hypothetical protein [unclassified Meridianimarinicoccus]|uniref:hypothetical protein n=1 Tax=unclassified Meridianimarinicoccus TaxID=2923344 RepID=UPI0018671C0A|nr:hypothetical protein [Fluviibacterium sp. MJW13]